MTARTDAEADEYHAIEPRLREIEALQKERQPYAAADQAIAGCVVTIGHDGALRVEKGLVRPDDIPVVQEDAKDVADDSNQASSTRPNVTPPTSSAPVPVSDPATTLRKADGISASLADDLRASRQHILRAHLAADYDVAFDAMLYTSAIVISKPDQKERCNKAGSIYIHTGQADICVFADGGRV